MSDLFQNLFGSRGNTGQDILRAAQEQSNRGAVTNAAGGRTGDQYCMHSITAAAKAAGYSDLHRELRSTLGNVNNFVALAQKHGAYHSSNGSIPPAGAAAIMDLSPHRPGADHVGISYGDGRYREANPGFRDVSRGSTGITGYVDLDALNRSISQQRRSDIVGTPVDTIANLQLPYSDVTHAPLAQHTPHIRVAQSPDPARGT